MKLLSSYIKEMKIAARGYYFYIEIAVAIILLAILLFAVNEQPISNSKEFLYYNMPSEVVNNLFDKQVKEGSARKVDPIEFKLEAIKFDITNQETGKTTVYDFDKEKTIEVEGFEILDSNTGKLLKTIYFTETEEDMIRISYSELKMGATIVMNKAGEFSYKYYLQGYETDRMVDLLYILHNKSPDAIVAQNDAQVIRTLDNVQTLNNRENMVPAFIVFAGSLMGFFIVMAYIFLDKSEGVIRAFAVTPSPVWKYLLSKIMIILTTVIVSSSIIAIPIMGGQPNYLLFYIFLIVTTFTFASLGLLVSSFFDSISKSFGVMYGIMIALMLPAFSYYIPSFDPLWLRFFPTYPMLQGFKEIILENGDIGYVLTYTLVFLVGGLGLFLLANIKFKKTLTM